jgi:hypothetical protein
MIVFWVAMIGSIALLFGLVYVLLSLKFMYKQKLPIAYIFKRVWSVIITILFIYLLYGAAALLLSFTQPFITFIQSIELTSFYITLFGNSKIWITLGYIAILFVFLFSTRGIGHIDKIFIKYNDNEVKLNNMPIFKRKKTANDLMSQNRSN